MSKKIAVLITDEFEDSEFTSPADEFRKAGHEVITIEKQAGKTVKGRPVAAGHQTPQASLHR
ncbi:DJ-1/PfpI family protein, partial [Escherichia sp. TWPC-MK]